MDLCDAVDVRGDENREVRHVNDVVAHDVKDIRIQPVCLQLSLAVEDLLVDVGQKIGERQGVPLLQRLRHDGVVGEVEASGADLERLVKGEPFRLQDAQKLGDGDDGVGIVELEAPLLGQLL